MMFRSILQQVNYTGKLEDGTVFDTTWKSHKNMHFSLQFKVCGNQNRRGTFRKFSLKTMSGKDLIMRHTVCLMRD